MDCTSPTFSPLTLIEDVPIEPSFVVVTSNTFTTPVCGNTSLIAPEFAPNGSPYWSVVTNVTGNSLPSTTFN